MEKSVGEESEGRWVWEGECREEGPMTKGPVHGGAGYLAASECHSTGLVVRFEHH